MKFIVGEREYTLRQKFKNEILKIDSKADIVECETWDCTLLDLIRSETSEIIFLDLNIMGVNWFQRVSELLSTIQYSKVVLIADTIDTDILIKCFEAGIIGYIPYEDLDEKLPDILRLLIHHGLYVPRLLVSHKKENTASEDELELNHKAYQLPEGGSLTRRQVQVLKYLQEGLSNKQISAQMGITEPTVKLHIHGLFHKLGATNRTQIVLKAQKLGFLR